MPKTTETLSVVYKNMRGDQNKRARSRSYAASVAGPAKTLNCPPQPANVSFLPFSAVFSSCVGSSIESSVPSPVR